MASITIYGLGLSPFVRKVRVALREKGVDYTLVSVAPPQITPEQRIHSPLGKIPFAEIDGKWLADSTVICGYLERLYPKPALLPPGPYDAARALWFEEFIDGGAVPKLAGTIFFERFIAPRFMKRAPDEEKVARAMSTDLPVIYGYLDRQIGDKPFLVADRYTLADITVASFFVNMQMVEAGADPDAYPHLARYLSEQLARPAMATVLAQEQEAAPVPA